MLIAILTYHKPLAEVEKLLEAHRDFLSDCYATGKLLVSGPQNPRTGGVIIAKISSKSEFEELLSQDPFAKEGIASHEIIEFDPVLYDDMLKELF